MRPAARIRSAAGCAQPQFDVAVIGGGPAGAAAALALRQVGATVILIERQPAPAWKIGETLAPEAKVELQGLGIWPEFIREKYLPSLGLLSSWGRGGLQAKDFIFNPYGSGWQLDRAKFEAFVLRQASSAGAEVRFNTSLERIRRRSGAWILHLPSGPVGCQHVIDASGRSSGLARPVGVRRIKLDRLVSVYAILPPAPSQAPDGRTLIESQADGWFYAAQTPDGRRTVAFQTDADLVPPRGWREPSWLIQKIRRTEHLRPWLGGTPRTFAIAPRLTSAHSARLSRCTAPGWMAIGDAALSFDPLSGFGIMKALQSARRAAQALADARPAAQREYSSWTDQVWDEYVERRRDYYRAEVRWPSSPFWSRRQ